MTVDHKVIALLTEDDIDIPILLSMNVGASLDISSGGVRKVGAPAKSGVATSASSSESTSPSTQTDESVSCSSKDFAHFTNEIHVSDCQTDGCSSHQLQKQPSVPNEDLQSLCNDVSTIGDDPSESVSLAAENADDDSESTVSTVEGKVETLGVEVPTGTVSDAESVELSFVVGDEPFIKILLREADALQRAKGRLERVNPFEKSQSSNSTRIVEDGEPKHVMMSLTLQNVEYMAGMEEASGKNDLSTIEGRINREVVSEVFSRRTIPQVIPISTTPEDVSTLWDGTDASGGLHDETPCVFIQEDEEMGVARVTKKEEKPSVPSSLVHFLRSCTPVETFFFVLTITSATTLVIIIILVISD